MKKCSLFLAIKEMEIKTTLRFHLTPVRIATSRTPAKTNVGQDAEEKGTLIYCWWECKLVQPLLKQYGGFLKN
jgi:hypothetical protein